MSKLGMLAVIALCGACDAPPKDQRSVDAASAPRDAEAALDGHVSVDAAAAPRDAGVAADASSPARDSSAPPVRDASDAQLASPDAGGPRDSDAGRDAGARTTSGCGVSAGGDGAFATRSIRVGGVDRVYRILVPSTYDPSRPYPVIFRWHGWGGDGLSGGLDIQHASGEEAIVVSGDAVSAAWDLTPGGTDVAYFDALLDEVGRAYCVDRDRIYSYGFSRGGGMTNLLACERADVIRASAAVAGLAAWSASCTRPIATWLLHDAGDDAVPVGDSIAMRDRFVAANGCAAATTPVDPSPCVRYDGCGSDPVVWCQTSGYGHDIRGDLAPAAVWSFFRSLP